VRRERSSGLSCLGRAKPPSKFPGPAAAGCHGRDVETQQWLHGKLPHQTKIDRARRRPGVPRTVTNGPRVFCSSRVGRRSRSGRRAGGGWRRQGMIDMTEDRDAEWWWWGWFRRRFPAKYLLVLAAHPAAAVTAAGRGADPGTGGSVTG
jgi:hypothetical protein